MATECQPCVLLTGATGFLGKVVLQELCRQKNQGTLPTHKILLLIRSKAGTTIQQRFDHMTQSLCFSRLDERWTGNIHLVEGDLQAPRCGLPLDSYVAICSQVTHIIHCAASVDFDMPLAKAASANIDSCLNILNLAQNCPHLQQMVTTSTAYVTPHTASPIKPELTPLPESAESLYRAIQSNTVDEKKLLESSENLISSRKAGSLPVTIVRPSIISAAWRYPFTGWLDSRAAVGGFVGLLGAGYLHVSDGRKDTRLDIVPVDQVANDLIREVRLSSYHRQHDQANLHREAFDSKTKSPITVTATSLPHENEGEETEDEDTAPMIHLSPDTPSVPLRIQSFKHVSTTSRSNSNHKAAQLPPHAQIFEAPIPQSSMKRFQSPVPLPPPPPRQKQ
ncbi:male sterility protein-domain-containing protein [Exophiala viscosa]|uniref:Fatty acyl-CoA reductase n=1 Tax=Exophiala viscosa TaxID=2486360 RepID=A0AAN6IDK3_9EURO|nr:male sterility protein-domain-containing protein [Exophiala viscosa]